MSKENPQNNDFIKSKKCANWQYICELTLFVLTLIQLFNPSKFLLVIASIILIVEYILSYFDTYFSLSPDKWHLATNSIFNNMK